MSNPQNQSSSWVDGMALALIGAALLTVPLALFGWVRDLPKHVKAAEGFFELAAQWISACFHVLGPFFLWTIAGGDPGVLPWVLTWTLFGSLVLARRIGALWSVPAPVWTRDWWQGVGLAGPAAVVVFGLAFVAGWIQNATHTIALLHAPLWVAAAGVGTWLYVTSTLTGWRVHRRAVKLATLRATFTGVLSTVFGISQSVLDAEAGWKLNDRGHLVISPVPPAMAAKLTVESLAELDAVMAHVYPDFEIDPDSGFQWIGVRPVTEETRHRRDELDRTGGLYVTAAAPHSNDTPHTPDQPSGVLDLTEGGW